MENFAKIAGVQDASRHTEASNSMQHPEPPAVPHNDQDTESQTVHSVTPKHSRASLPLDRRLSRKSIREHSSHPSLPDHQHEEVPPLPLQYTAARDSVDSEQAEGLEEEIPWGPQHPCFPHPNPHVPLNSSDYSRTRIIRVQRDWLIAGDLYPALQNMYPEILMDQLEEADFRQLIEKLNAMLKDAFSPWATRAAIDTVMGVLTGFLWDDAGFTGAKSGVRAMEKWMETWNKDMQQQGRQIRLISLRKTAFLSLDIQIPDPGIDGPDGEDGVA